MGLAEKNVLDEKWVNEINLACKMMINHHELERRAGLLDVEPDEEQPPDFLLMARAGTNLNRTRPWDVRLQEVLEEELELERELFFEDDAEKEDVSYSQFGLGFDWEGTARGETAWSRTLKNKWENKKHFGVMWIDSTDKQWALDVLLGFQWKDGELEVITHELRPRNDEQGWDLNGEFVPKRHGLYQRQVKTTDKKTLERYWDNKCIVRKRGMV